MNKYYDTMSPSVATHILKATEGEAIESAKRKVSEDGRTRYVVQIIAIVEKDYPPVKVTIVE